MLSRGGEEVQRGAEGQVREVRVRWRGHLVHPRPRGLRRALRGTRRRVGHRCHPHRVKVIRDKDDNRLSAHMTRRRESPLERDAPARRYTRAPTTNAKTRGHPLNIDVACKLFSNMSQCLDYSRSKIVKAPHPDADGDPQPPRHLLRPALHANPLL